MEINPENRKRIAIVYPFPNIDSVPSLCSASVLFADHGYKVDIYTYTDDKHVLPEFEQERITVISAHNPTYRKGSTGRFILGKIYWTYCRFVWLVQFAIRHGTTPHACMVAVDPSGLVLANFLNRLIGVRMVYYSLELLLSYELITDEDRVLKERERRLVGKVAFAVAPDAERAEILSRDSGVPLEKILCVPNSPLGLAERKRSNYLRERFDIPSDTIIILNAGSLSVWSCVPELIKSTQDWPDDWVLVCHARNDWYKMNRDYIHALRCLAKPGRLIFSFDPLPRKEYPMLVRSADIGVAFYNVQDGNTYTKDNILHIGLSSGKLAYYLQAGLPVLVNGNPSLSRLVKTHECGEVSENPESTAGSIRGILRNYEKYSGNSIELFNRELQYESGFGNVLRNVETFCKP